MARKNKNLPKKDTVNLVSVGKYKREQTFPIETALNLLRLSNSQWELNDNRFIFENNDIKRNTGDKSNSPTEK